MALSDNEVTAELKKMVAFINQEALEKSKELHIKSDEEFTLEKQRLVRAEISSIDAAYAHKFKQAELAQQIARSTVTNKTRLRVLAAQQDLLTELFEKARAKLSEVTQDSERYKGILKNLILEGAYCLNEEKLSVEVREKDVGLVKEVIGDVESTYKEATGKTLKVEVDEGNCLPAESAGGAVIVGFHGKIDVNNTLEERLKIMEAEALPVVRTNLFGPSPNRKFFD